MRNPTPAPIVVPASGAPTCRGIALTVRPLRHWSAMRRDEQDVADLDSDAMVRLYASRAIHDGHVLCLRPTDTRPACVGLAPAHFAVASMEPDFPARALVVDPYDADGNDLREVLPMDVAFDPNIIPGQRVCDSDGSEFRVVSTRVTGGRDREPEMRVVLRPVEAFIPVVDPEAEAHAVAVWEASEAV